MGRGEDYCLNIRWAVPASVQYQRAVAALRVFPNPSHGQFVVDWQGEHSVDARIVDVLGRTVWTGTVQQGANALDLSAQGRGAYFLTMATESGTIAKRVLVE